MSIQYQAIENEAVIAAIMRRLQNGCPVQAGEVIQWEARFGDERPDSWTRGQREITENDLALVVLFHPELDHLIPVVEEPSRAEVEPRPNSDFGAL